MKSYNPTKKPLDRVLKFHIKETSKKFSFAEDVTRGIPLAGKTILITGCNSGLGKQSMRVLALRGAAVISVARTWEKAEAACRGAGGSRARGYAGELSDPSSVRACVESIKKDKIKLDYWHSERNFRCPDWRPPPHCVLYPQ